MLIMVLDHVRDFFHIGATVYDPTDMATTNPLLFFTRFITHFCAPNFVFLSGISAYLTGLKRSKKELSAFLIKRGLWLIAVELVLITFALTLNPFYNFIILQVIWAIGCSMVLLGLIIKAPIKVIGLIGLFIVLFHNLLDYVKPPESGVGLALTQLFFTARGTIIPLADNYLVLALYAVIPWTGVMFMGYALGSLFHTNIALVKRKRAFLYIGGSMITLFIILRFINAYGDPALWSVQKNAIYSIMSFFNTTKYPPSLLYVCMTVGPGLIALALLENTNGNFKNLLIVYGKVPFFYYVCHFYLIRIVNIIFFYAIGYSQEHINEPGNIFLFRPASFGYNLGIVYLIWFCIIALLYFPCKWFMKYKATHSNWWLSYL
jgi:uncharacterized membrane protein